MSKLLKIDITTDTICPWCYVGHRRLEKALQHVNRNTVKVQRLIHPFFLNPSWPEDRPVNKLEHYREKFGQERTQQMIPYMTQTAAQEGIKMSYGGLVGSTLRSHRLVKWAERFGKSEEVLKLVYQSYFEQEKDISSIDVLVSAAQSAGLDPEAARAFLASNELTTEVREEATRIADQFNISGVPFFTINDKLSFSGAVAPDEFIQAFRQLGVDLSS